MKRIFLVMLVAMIATVSCQKSELTGQNGSGDEVTVNISAVMQSDNATTRAITEKGKASQINRCIMEIYTSDNELYQRQVTSVDNTSLKASFTINLVPDKNYDFVFWADYSTDSESDYYYTTNGDNGLKEITADYTGYEGNDEKRDAFFATVNKTITASASNVEAELYRPFGQVNVSTYVTDLISSYLPTTVQVEYTSNNIATTFNAFDGTTSGTTDFAWKEAATVIETPAVGSADLFHLSTDYIFAPAEGQALIDFMMEFFNNGASIMTNDKFTSIPVQRNYRTNISGNLLTIGSEITVEVVPTFTESDIEVEITTVETVAEVSNALAVVTTGDDANVTVTGEVTGNDNHIEVPAAEAGKTGETSITVTFEDVDAGAAISFGGATSSDNSEYDGTVYINAPADVEFEDLTINLPYAHVVFNGEAQTTNASTGPGTFVVAEGASIGTLNVNAGNVDVYGTVGTITRDDEKNISSITTVKIYIPDGDIQKAYEMVGNYESLVLNEKFEIIAIDSNSSNIELALSFELADFTSTTVLPANCDKVNHWIITDAGSPTEAEFTNFRTILYNHNDLKNKGLILTFSQMEAIADDNIIAPTGKENTSVSTINAPKATKIGFAAFQSFKTLENINFPEVTTLGGFGEFMYCTSLEYVYLPKVEALSQWTFSDCTALLEVNLPELITVAYRSFYNCSVLSTVYLPEVETISQGGFMWCGTLKSIDLPSVTTVGTQAFNVCQKLETITLPSVTSIGSKAFGNSISLISMELATNPDTELTSFGVDGDVFDYSDAYSALSHVAASTVVTVGEGACTVTDNSLTVGDSTYEFKEIIVK